MKHVCFIQDGLGGGGAERVIVTLAGALANRGYCVEIGLYETMETAYTVDPRVRCIKIDRAHFAYHSAFEKVRFYLKYLPVTAGFAVLAALTKMVSPVIKKPYLYIQNRKNRYLRRINRTEPIRRFVEDRPDAVIISFMVHCYTNVAAALGTSKKNRLIISERDDPHTVTSDVVRKRRTFAMRLADACVFQTDQAWEYMSKDIGDRGVVIPNPLSETLPPAYAGEREKVIVNYCRLNEKKNLPLLIRAFARVHEEFPEYRLEIYGKGACKDQLLMLIHDLCLDECAFVYDFLPNIHETVKKYAMFVSSSDFEGISNSMIEALALGMPSVCTDCPIGGAAMFIRSHENGILTPVGDEDALYEAMKYMITHPDEAARMGSEAARIREVLCVDEIARQWIEVIEKGVSTS